MNYLIRYYHLYARQLGCTGSDDLGDYSLEWTRDRDKATRYPQGVVSGVVSEFPNDITLTVEPE